MKNCMLCGVELPDDAVFCHMCGKKQVPRKKLPPSKIRSNGGAIVFKLGKTWVAEVTLGFRMDEDGIVRRVKNRKYGFRTKKEALDYLPTLQGPPQEWEGDGEL